MLPLKVKGFLNKHWERNQTVLTHEVPVKCKLHTGLCAFSFSVLTSSFSLSQKLPLLSCSSYSLSSILVFRAPRSGKLKERKQAAYQMLLTQMGEKIRGRRPWHTGCISLAGVFSNRRQLSCWEKQLFYFSDWGRFFPNFCTANKGIDRSSCLCRQQHQA